MFNFEVDQTKNNFKGIIFELMNVQTIECIALLMLYCSRVDLLTWWGVILGRHKLFELAARAGNAGYHDIQLWLLAETWVLRNGQSFIEDCRQTRELISGRIFACKEYTS